MSAWEHVRKGVGALLEVANGSHASNMVGATLETPGEDNGLISRVEDLRDGRWKSVSRTLRNMDVACPSRQTKDMKRKHT